MGNFDNLLQRLDPDVLVRGKQFERICEWFLTNDPFYRRELRRVWLWSAWPGRWGPDAGIDLVAESVNGELWAIQAKAYDRAYRVTKRDIDTFLAESGRSVFTYRMLIATTDLISRTGERTIQDQEKRVTFLRLNNLRAASVEWPAAPNNLRPARPGKPARPRKHQREAVKKVIAGFESTDRGQLIMACGTGKTLTALFVKEQLEASRTLVLVPSLSLLKQTLNVWRSNATTEFTLRAVCSDETVTQTEDEALSHTTDIGVPVTTDPEEIAAFLRKRSGSRVVFATYQSSRQIAEAQALGRVPAFDILIGDEAHRCAGPVSSDFATVLDATAIRARRRLFMTATPRYFTGRVVEAALESDYEVASMDDDEKFGPTFHRLSFGEAIDSGLLTDYQVVIVGVDDDTYRAWAEKGRLVSRDGVEMISATTLAGQIGLAKAMKKCNLHRVISFHSRVARARDFAASMPAVLAWMPAGQRPNGRLWSHFASGEMPAGRRYVLLQQLAQLDDVDRGLLANARCLAEGVDVPTLDGVAFVDPRRSEVDIVQAVGRAIRKSQDKTLGTVVIPVFIDTSTAPEAALESSAFKPVWDVIKALRAHDAELGEQLDALRRQLGRERGRPRLPVKIHTDIPSRIGTDFARAFEVRLVEKSTSSWEFWFGLIEQYVLDNGDAQVHIDYTVDGHRLGRWCSSQRVKYLRDELAVDQAARLEDLPGWSWQRNDDRWEKGFALLLAYVDSHGHALVGAREEFQGFPLGSWAANQRRAYRRDELEHDRRQRLDAVPAWVWSLEEERWERGFDYLVQYVALYRHSRVPQPFTNDDGFRLGAWVNFQRTRFSRGAMETERAERLAILPGWVWRASEAKWEEGFERLRDYADEHGNVRVPPDYKPDGFKLRIWATNQRTKFDKLSRDRQRRLQDLPGWTEYGHTAKWEAGFQRLLDFVQEHGDAKVLRSYEVEGYPLGSWVMTQRQEFRKGTLAAERQERLARLPGWDWDRRIGKWDEGLQHLVEYVNDNGLANPASSYVAPDGYRLGAWTQQQRYLHNKTGQLHAERKKQLEKLPGWVWNPPRGAAAQH